MSQAAQASPGSGRRRLGRGLSSLLSTPVKVDVPEAGQSPGDGGTRQAVPSRSPDDRSTSAADHGDDPGLIMIPVEAIKPNEHQPRRTFDEAAMGALATSIQQAGMMQPIVVRPAKDGARYELIAGERRWRAAQRIGLDRVPALVRDVDRETAAQLALIENLQREDLNAVERAEAFRRLADEFDLTHNQIAERVGLDRSSVTNHLRLLELDPEILELVATGRLGMGHARGLLAITNILRRRSLADLAASEGWSVRELERHVRQAAGGVDGGKKDAPPPQGLPVHLADLQKRLGQHLGTNVRIQPGKTKGAGRLILEFYSIDQFEGLVERMGFDAS